MTTPVVPDSARDPDTPPDVVIRVVPESLIVIQRLGSRCPLRLRPAVP
jgi:hypothetical protein